MLRFIFAFKLLELCFAHKASLQKGISTHSNSDVVYIRVSTFMDYYFAGGTNRSAFAGLKLVDYCDNAIFKYS